MLASFFNAFLLLKEGGKNTMKTPTKYIVNRKKQHNRAVTLEISLFLAIAIIIVTAACLSFYYFCKFLVMIGG